MRSLNVEDYQISVQTPDGPRQEPYAVRGSLVALLLHPDQKLNAVELLARHAIGLRLLNDSSPVLLEEADYAKLRGAVEAFRGYGGDDVELVKRVLEAPVVAVVPAVAG